MPDLSEMKQIGWIKWTGKDDCQNKFFWLFDNFLPGVIGTREFDKNFVNKNINSMWDTVNPTDVAFIIYQLSEKADLWKEQYDIKEANGRSQQRTPVPAQQDAAGGHTAGETESGNGSQEHQEDVSSLSTPKTVGKGKWERVPLYGRIEMAVAKMVTESGEDIAKRYKEHREKVNREAQARKDEEVGDNKEKRKREEGPKWQVMMDRRMLCS